MSYRKRESLSKRLGVSLVDEPHVQSPASLMLLNRDLSQQDETLYNYQEWLTFRDKYFADIFERDYCIRCAYCQKDLIADTKDTSRVATIDHIIPVSKGGEVFNLDNLVSACYSCNQNKADKTLTVENK
jgi:5-methylcytosine-specific restriction endonuclease McrA